MSSVVDKKSSNPHTGLPRARARFLAQAIQLEEEAISKSVRIAIYSILGLIFAIMVWMSLTRVSEVTVTGGKVVPAGYIHNIQHLEGGIVGTIRVHDGDRVEAGDPLLSLAPPASQSDYGQLVIRKAILQFDLARLAAIRENKDPDFGEYAAQYPQFALKEMEALRAQLASYNSELAVIDARIEQRISELTRQKNQVVVLEIESSILQKQVDIRIGLAERNVISQTDLLTIQSEHAAIESELMSASDNVVIAQMALEEERKKRGDAIARHSKEVEQESASAENQLAEVENALVKAKDKVDRLEVYAPVTGIVQGLAITTINAVVGPGEVIMQIVPVDDEMIVESRLMPDQVGYIHPGQQADIRVDSYDSSRYGTIKGSVRQISPSTYLDEKANPYYKVKVGLDKSWLGELEGQMPVIPGMTVQVDIITGSKTVMEFLMKPVTRGFQSAFTQR